MKKLIYLATMSMCFVMFANDIQSTSDGKVSIKEKLYHYNMKKYGGRLRQPNSEKGKIIVVNKQSLINQDMIDKVIQELVDKYRYTIEVSSQDVQSQKGLIVIRLEETDRRERIILAPEDLWVSLNVKSLAIDNPPNIFLKDRFDKEFKRSFAMVCCGTASDNGGSLMMPMNSLSDIDAFGAVIIPPDVNARISGNMPTVGMKPYRVCKYVEACQEGWAPAPTNEFQQAIWDKVHEIPSEPLKIKRNK